MRLLIIRFSALGDIAMTVPIIDSLAKQYPHLEITVLSKPFAAPIFSQMPANVKFQGADIKQYSGFTGLLRLFCKLRKEKYDAVADLHDVLRSKVLRGLFFLFGKKTAHIDKGRKEKKTLIRAKHKILRPLTSSFNRYADVFQQLGFPVEIKFNSIYKEKKGDTTLFQDITGVPDNKHWIGIAPFAAHKGKILPDETIATLIHEASLHDDWKIFLFGGGKAETEKLEAWAGKHLNVQSLAGKLNMNQELSLMSYLEAMISMDSANMHLASLTGTPVISIWGATHPYAGFMGWKQSIQNAIQVDLPCRPCSIFGNKPCWRGDYACLTGIRPESIIQHLEKVIKV
ncbi:glycosyltransferase family 9 protein [Bacteroides sp.]|uniref:glycosyltransferase family 9 protein n=1 Tax=Bacteroides sp. TaxID=29523 RepID=UPI0026263987|nr:glycosyltransferase family 9 protein [Bacteroides sp.]